MKADPPFPERRAASRRAFKAPLGIGWQVTLKAALKNRRHITAELTRNLRGTYAKAPETIDRVTRPHGNILIAGDLQHHPDHSNAMKSGECQSMTKAARIRMEKGEVDPGCETAGAAS